METISISIDPNKKQLKAMRSTKRYIGYGGA